ncbi:hypothetical protein [Phytoactinopolyspora mesophila]|uniref:ATP-grasp domain-containing protein n=1 Tax=Phytoactinopolyspora mesophila TaxID=2650750 RepID=A0A7K3M294_9ACTN|nr:hypothetical protein [Phytoactinopolyspora mesophila]NDL57423.1 hypothetical protein [Phytoactinopolyspora mesophila]
MTMKTTSSDNARPPADAVEPGTYYELSTHLLALEVIRRGYQPRWLRKALFVVEIDGRVYGWNMTRCTITSTVGFDMTGRKDYTRDLLRRAGLTVAVGGTFDDAEYDKALTRVRRIGWPVVVKPAGRGSGRGVTVGVTDEAAFRDAWTIAAGGRVVVERQAAGTEARFLTVGGRCVAVAGRIPAHVVGDGSSMLRQLVAAKNEFRQDNPHLRRHVVPLRGDPEHVPAPGERLVMDDRGGFSTGADSVDLTDVVHPTYLEVAGQAELAFPQLGVAGVDIIATDYRQPASPDNHIILEVNSRPAIGAHHFPWEGKPRDVARAIVDACLV